MLFCLLVYSQSYLFVSAYPYLFTFYKIWTITLTRLFLLLYDYLIIIILLRFSLSIDSLLQLMDSTWPLPFFFIVIWSFLLHLFLLERWLYLWLTGLYKSRLLWLTPYFDCFSIFFLITLWLNAIRGILVFLPTFLNNMVKPLFAPSFLMKISSWFHLPKRIYFSVGNIIHSWIPDSNIIL